MKMRFRFKNFSLAHDKSTLKIGTDSVLLSAMVPIENRNNILDIGTGCGVIAFCLADKLRRATITSTQILGIDIDEQSIEEANENLLNFPAINNLSIAFEEKSIQDVAKTTNVSFDLIVTNPPYFGASLKPANPALEKSKHRDNNLSFIDLIECVLILLKPKGVFYLILPPAEFEEWKELTIKGLFLNHYCQIFPKKGKPANRIVAGFGKSCTGDMKSENIIIRDEKGDYTAGYRKLTEDLYLHLR